MEFGLIDKLKGEPSWLVVFFFLGSLSLLKFLFAVLKWVYVNFLRAAKDLKKYGSWALVTGPTDGSTLRGNKDVINKEIFLLRSINRRLCQSWFEMDRLRTSLHTLLASFLPLGFDTLVARICF